jgi:hypothetical protein
VDEIPYLLNEIQKANLWKLFETVDKKVVAFDPQFKKRQTLREDRLGEPTFKMAELRELPGPSGSNLEDEVENEDNILSTTISQSDFSVEKPVSTPKSNENLKSKKCHSGILPATPAEGREGSEVKRRKKESPPTPQNPEPMDNSKPPKEPFERNTTPEQVHQVEVLALELQDYWRQATNWVKNHILNAHPEAIIYTLEEIKKHRPPNPFQYAETILARQSGNFREQDFIVKGKGVNFGDLVEKLRKV